MSQPCDYCGEPAVKIDPFAQNPCCDGCFNVIIGGEADDPPWRCGNAPEPVASDAPEANQ